jgi:DNA polymerase-3 subunit alpha
MMRISKYNIPKLKNLKKRHILTMEKEMTGYVCTLSGHPLEEYEQTLKSSVSVKISDILAMVP